MTVRLNQLNAQYAHRREVEQNRVEARQSVNRYYDHWGQVTTRFDNWTNKNYYENAEKKLQQKKDFNEKHKILEHRRSKLAALFATEHASYEREIDKKNRPKPREINADINTLKGINENLREREQLKRKLEMEAKLYGRWRHGVDDQSELFHSKSDNEVLAKLNWLDKQIDNQLQQEKDDALAQERTLRLQEEINKTQQAQKDQQLLREQEIKEIRALQECHIEELKKRQQETEKLKEEEQHMRIFLAEIEKERELLEDSTALIIQRPDFSQAFNLRKIKVFLRNRLETCRKQVNICVNILERLRTFAIKPDVIATLLKKYKEQLDNESLGYVQIESMYESEAKSNLCRCEEAWREQHLKRYEELKQLFDTESSDLGVLLEENIRQQKEIVELRSTHLAAIDNSNERLKFLCEEQKRHENAIGGEADRVEISDNIESLVLPQNSRDQRKLNKISENDASIPQVTSSFNNLNLDCWNNLQSKRERNDSVSLNRTLSMNVVTAANAEIPKFGRKRVAWT